MINVMNQSKNPTKEAVKTNMDPQLWQACAGNMVQIPTVNSKVFYFPQGHLEHYASLTSDLKNYSNLPAVIPCTVSSITYLADHETDDVYARIQLVPLGDDFGVGGCGDEGVVGCCERPVSFAKTLTQSDANNGGGFSVPRYCAETIFPRLDYSADPPVQTIVAKDVHGVAWKFRHIYRGTPRRHLLTTGWSNFVNQKKLVAGDSIVFLRAENGDLCVGIRRPKRGVGCLSGWNNGSCGLSYGGFLGNGEGKLVRNYDGLVPNGKVKAETLVEAAKLAANGEPFEVVYYPRWGTPEFFVKASVVKAAMQVEWCGGMRFKMAFETEDSSRISWFMGTVSSVQVTDPIRWPNSPWRLLQVAWDEPELLQNVKKVNPWLVELVATLPTVHMSPLSPPRKKFRLPQASDFPFTGHFPIPPFPSSTTLNPFRPVFGLPDKVHSGIQGARHSQFGHFTPDFHTIKVNGSLPKYSNINFLEKPLITENLSSFLTMATSEEEKIKKSSSTRVPFMLFGKPILTEKEISENSGDSTMSSLSETSSSERRCPGHEDHHRTTLGLGTGPMESRDVDSYKEFYKTISQHVWQGNIRETKQYAL
ncbi:hypothetical protein vseg_002768 [Gypsophila vaccaria]